MLGEPIVVLTGELDIYRLPYLREVLSGVDGPTVIDLSGVRLLTAAALTELVLLARRVGNRKVTLAAANPNVRRVLAIVEFDRLFRIVDDVTL